MRTHILTEPERTACAASAAHWRRIETYLMSGGDVTSMEQKIGEGYGNKDCQLCLLHQGCCSECILSKVGHRCGRRTGNPWSTFVGSLSGPSAAAMAVMLESLASATTVESVFGEDGYDSDGVDEDGVDRDGYDRDGYDEDGRDREGYNKYGHDKDGWDRYGYDADCYDRHGRDRDGYDRYGVNRDGWDRHGYDRYGLDRYGLDKDGLDKDGRDRAGRGKV